VRSLAKIFSRQGKRIVALDNSDLTVGDGEFVTTVSPSGWQAAFNRTLVSFWAEVAGAAI
jgi:hypothetical protein